MARRPLSVLVTGTVADRLNSNVAIRRYIAAGFRDVGPDVEVHEVAYETLAAAPRGASLEAATSFRVEAVDLVLAVGGVAVDASDLHALRRVADRAGAPLLVWVHDDPYEFDYAFRLAGIADLVLSNDRWSTYHYDDVPAVHMPLAACPHTHFRPIGPGTARDLGLFFCGYPYRNRVAFLRSAADILRRHAAYVCGPGWRADLPFAHDTRMTPDLFADTAARSLLTLNIGRDLSIANARLNLVPSTPGPRTFEVALMGSTQLFVTEGLEILDYFERDREILLVEGPADLAARLEQAMDDPASVVAVAERAQGRALAEHCYVHRAEAVIRHARERGLLAPRAAKRGEEPAWRRAPELDIAAAA